MAIMSLAELIRTHAQARYDKACITFEGRTISYGDLDRRSNQVANALLGEGVGAADRVAILDKNAIEYFELLFGGSKVNAANVAVNWRLAPPEIAGVLQDSQAKVLVVGHGFVDVLDAIAGELAAIKKIVVIGGHEGYESWDEWVDGQATTDTAITPTPDDVGFQLYTSGTTGLPKGVMLSNANLFSMLPTAAPDWGFDESSINLVAMPLFHIAGSGYAVVGMFVGCHTILLREVDPAGMLQLIGEKGVTNMLAVPAILQFMLMVPGKDDLDYSTLRSVLYGASPISVEVLSGAIRLFAGASFSQAYGMTETTGGIVSLRPEDHDPDGPNAHRLRAAGKPNANVELRIVDPDTDADVAQGEVGEIWTRSGQNMLGYWNKPDETANTITDDGWLKTGDAGYLDADGYLYIHDRVKDMIISGGENVYPAEIENCLMSCPGVADVAAVGIPSDKWGEAVHAFVVKAQGQDPTTQEVIAFARARLAHFKCPSSVDFVDALPRNPSGKILRRELRAPFWEGRERGVN
ncbi:MAG TPA: long-chain-fatty-acid--CoA ligase [Acidimicrobiales bacterium]|nr:long-chain-fatty-acid--CoA ligase [Acidimicrobiales bacterium]